MVNDVLSDALARLQNGVLAKKESVVIEKSKVVSEVLKLLKHEGMLFEYTEEDGKYTVYFVYVDGEPLVTTFKRISKPGKRVYVKSGEILPVVNGRGVSIISTSKGLKAGAVAKAEGLGGEYICQVW